MASKIAAGELMVIEVVTLSGGMPEIVEVSTPSSRLIWISSYVGYAPPSGPATHPRWSGSPRPPRRAHGRPGAAVTARRRHPAASGPAGAPTRRPDRRLRP